MSGSATAQRHRPSRLKEGLAALRWAIGSWLRPADSEAGWQQRLGHGVGMFENPEHEPLPRRGGATARKSTASGNR